MFKMVRERTLQDKWEYRRKNEADSSDNGPNSTSSAEPVFKKLKQISELMSNKSRKESSNALERKESSNALERKKARHTDSIQIVKRQKLVGSDVHRRMKRTFHVDDVHDERGSYEPATMSSNLLYMNSILEELRVAREKMFEWMRGEVHKLMADSVPDFAAQEGPEWKNVKSMPKMHLPSTGTESVL